MARPREHGAVLLDGKQVDSTLMCCHCGTHFEVVRGSGRVRGFCLRCSDVTCGAQQCVPCAPIEARLDAAEGKKTGYAEAILESGFLL